jgi:hypothetical protein
VIAPPGAPGRPGAVPPTHRAPDARVRVASPGRSAVAGRGCRRAPTVIEERGVSRLASMSAVDSIAPASRPSQSSTTSPGRSSARAPATASRTGAGSTGAYVGSGSRCAPPARNSSRTWLGQASADNTRIGLATSWRICAAWRYRSALETLDIGELLQARATRWWIVRQRRRVWRATTDDDVTRRGTCGPDAAVRHRRTRPHPPP